ncbi:MAG: TIGR01548 family HAD-type hydrolase [Pleurocapsa sp.]
MNKDKPKAIIVFDIDGVIRDVGNSYRRAISDTVEHFTDGAWRPTMEDLDTLKSEGIWNNDWRASEELVYRYFDSQGRSRDKVNLDYDRIVDFFQGRYRGTNPEAFDGYITTEPLLVSTSYLQQLSDNNIGWGFFSGATRGSAEYVLKQRLGLTEPVLIAMEDAPGKPDPTGLFAAIAKITSDATCPVFYLGDTVADMLTIIKAREVKPAGNWIGIGILPPHVQSSARQTSYGEKLKQAGAAIVLNNVEQLDFKTVEEVLNSQL